MRLSEPLATRKAQSWRSLLQRGLFLGVQREPLSAGGEPGTGSKGDAPLTLRSVSMETIQEMR